MTTAYHPRTLVLLAEAGLAPEELAALEQAPLIRMPSRPEGFGLMGHPGTGKTWSVAHYMAGRWSGRCACSRTPLGRNSVGRMGMWCGTCAWHG